MKIYFNTQQFPDTLIECSTNFPESSSVRLTRDIEYIAGDKNRIVLEDDTDRNDFNLFLDNCEELFSYVWKQIGDDLDKNFPGALIPRKIDVLQHAFVLRSYNRPVPKLEE